MDRSELRVLEISAEETYPIRQELLRSGRPLEEVQFQGDQDATTVHLGVFLNDRLIGIASFVRNKHESFEFQNQYQLRGMAILPEFQKRQVGHLLLHAGENLLKNEKNCEFLWCNARESAVNFYLRNNYKTHGDYFEIPNVCTHIVMVKPL